MDKLRAGLGVMALSCACVGCTSGADDFEARVQYEFSEVVAGDDTRVLGYALVIDGASWKRLTDRKGRTREMIQQDTDAALHGVIKANLETVNGCVGLPWHFSRISRLPDGSLRFELTCGGTGSKLST